MKDGILGFFGCMMTSITIRDEVSAWVSLICSLAIAVVTCGIQIWRMIRDRNSDKKRRKKMKKRTTKK